MLYARDIKARLYLYERRDDGHGHKDPDNIWDPEQSSVLVMRSRTLVRVMSTYVYYNVHYPSMEGNEKEGKATGNDIEKETLKPITKAKSKEDKELQEWEVESTGGGLGAGGG
jgi:hypothetical protein